MECLYCKKEFEPKSSRSRFCKRSHQVIWSNKRRPKVIWKCERCGLEKELYIHAFHNKKGNLCITCSNKLRVGENSPTWKGGDAIHPLGRFGRDKDNLSWKIQRKLAWERDENICQDCGIKNLKRKLDVHHIHPYKISFSHSLENLICLCHRCHMKHEAQCQEKWGGQLIEMKKKEKVCLTCNDCGKVLKKRIRAGLCIKCFQLNMTLEIKNLREILNVKEILAKLSISQSYLYYLEKNFSM